MKKAVTILYVALGIQILMIPVGIFLGQAAIVGMTREILRMTDERYVHKQNGQ